MIPFIIKLDHEIQSDIALKAKELRLYYGLKRKTLAERSAVSESSIKRFETTGEISLKSLIAIARVLNNLDEFETMFHIPEAKSIAELRKQQIASNKNRPKRGRK